LNFHDLPPPAPNDKTNLLIVVYTTKKMSFRLSPNWPVYLLGALMLLLSLVTVVGERGVVHLWRLGGEKTRLNEQNYRLQQENEALRQRIHRLRHDNAALEKLAREELAMVKPGDVVYRFPKSAPPSPFTAPTQSLPSRERKSPQ
jgi:cell division protein FtsB